MTSPDMTYNGVDMTHDGPDMTHNGVASPDGTRVT